MHLKTNLKQKDVDFYLPLNVYLTFIDMATIDFNNELQRLKQINKIYQNLS